MGTNRSGPPATHWKPGVVVSRTKKKREKKNEGRGARGQRLKAQFEQTFWGPLSLDEMMNALVAEGRYLKFVELSADAYWPDRGIYYMGCTSSVRSEVPDPSFLDGRSSCGATARYYRDRVPVPPLCHSAGVTKCCAWVRLSPEAGVLRGPCYR